MRTSVYNHKKEEWAEKYNSGMSFRAIAAEEGISKATVQNIIKDVVEKRSKSPYDKFGKKWVDLYVNQAYLVSHIASQYNTTYSVVVRVLEKEGIPIEKKEMATRKYTHLVSTWVKQYNEGMSLTEISNESSVNRQTILNYLREEEVEIRDYADASRKYELDEEYFKEIDSPEKAYWLGVFFARGVTLEHLMSWSISLSLVEEKVDMLTAFQAAIGTERPFTRRKHEKTVDLRLQSRPLFEQLRDLGLGKDKTKTLEFPEKLPEHFANPFIKGYIEARGHYNHGMLYVGGTVSFLNTLEEILFLHVGIDSAIRKLTFDSGDSYVLKVRAKNVRILNEWFDSFEWIEEE